MRIADSTAVPFTTGSEPGRPRQVGQTCVLGSAPNSVGQPQNIFVAVLSSTWTSRPITGSNVSSASSNGTRVVIVVIWLLRGPAPCRAADHPTAPPAGAPGRRPRGRAGGRPRPGPGSAPRPAAPPRP